MPCSRQAHHGRALRSRRAGRLRDGDDAPLARLVTIPISHYCEKARWALERARLGYREERHVQGVNRFASRRAGGHGTLPVLLTRHGVFASSESILRYADLHLDPDDRLFTGDPEVEALSRHFDATLGPDGRRLIYAHMLRHPDVMLPFNNQGVPAWEAMALTGLFGLAARWARRELAIKDPDDDRRRVYEVFDTVAEPARASTCAGTASPPPTSPSPRSPPPSSSRPSTASRSRSPSSSRRPRARRSRPSVRTPPGVYALELFARHRRNRPRAS